MSASSEPEGKSRSPVEELVPDACWEFLASQQVGRLAVSVGGVPDIFPLNYGVLGRTVLLHTTEGTKLAELTANRSVAFEVDKWNERQATSVVLRGRAAVLEDEAELAEARALQLHSWLPTPKTVYVQIRPMSITGRRLHLTADVHEGRTGEARDIADLAWVIAANWRLPSVAPSREERESWAGEE
jgi:nitroimidazol reductase NimA-like FMN-containing flavoprotein (pyridoxamine 5'-phosphate oxidase superfamily)